VAYLTGETDHGVWIQDISQNQLFTQFHFHNEPHADQTKEHRVDNKIGLIDIKIQQLGIKPTFQLSYVLINHVINHQVNMHNILQRLNKAIELNIKHGIGENIKKKSGKEHHPVAHLS
jgi:hypothetical protein